MSTGDKKGRPTRRTLVEAIALGGGVGVALGVTQDSILLGVGIGVATGAAVAAGRSQRSKHTADPD